MNEEIIIVGASVAGLSAAIKLCEMGLRPLILERKTAIGYPLQCAEFVPALFVNEAKHIGKFISQHTNGLRMLIDNGKNIEQLFLPSPGYIVHRDKWEQYLAAHALNMGAKIFVGEAVTKIIIESGSVVVTTTKRTIKTKVVIGADGPKSTVAKFAGLPEQKLVPAYQWRVHLSHRLNENIALFASWIKGGYGWLFPKLNLANLGVGGYNANPKLLMKVAERLGYFLGIDKFKPIEIMGGLLPIGGVREKISFDRVLLVGDAAGFTDPVTGAGIASAWETGALAAKAAYDFIKNGVPLKSYDELTRPLARAVEKSRERRLSSEAKIREDGDIKSAVRLAWRIR